LDFEAESLVAVAAPDASAHEANAGCTAQRTHELATWWNFDSAFHWLYPVVTEPMILRVPSRM
jgi:hypothetical protein